MIASLLGPDMRRPLLLLLGALVLGSLLFHVSLSEHVNSQYVLIRDKAEANAAALAVRETPARLAQAGSEARLYERIRRDGFIGPEDRAGWITALGRVQPRLRLDSLSWRMAPRTTSPLAAGLWLTPIDITASPLDTEGLATLLAQLRDTAPGRFTVAHCSLALNPGGLAGQATCRLNWWTLAGDAVAGPANQP